MVLSVEDLEVTQKVIDIVDGDTSIRLDLIVKSIWKTTTMYLCTISLHMDMNTLKILRFYSESKGSLKKDLRYFSKLPENEFSFIPWVEGDKYSIHKFWGK